jgi:hypothetical protein
MTTTAVVNYLSTLIFLALTLGYYGWRKSQFSIAPFTRIPPEQLTDPLGFIQATPLQTHHSSDR